MFHSEKVVNLSIQHSNLSGTVSNNRGPKYLLKRHGQVYSDSWYFYTLLSVVDRTDRLSVKIYKIWTLTIKELDLVDIYGTLPVITENVHVKSS